MITMPKDVKPPTHRSSNPTSFAAGGGTRSSSWSAKDDETLISARAQGLNWNQIAPRHFSSKTPNACRKRHERLMEKQHAEQWDGVKLEDLAQAYMNVRREMWSILAAQVGEKWQLVEQKCMEKGLKNLSQAYRSAQKKQGTYDSQDDSGIGVSDPEDEADDRHADMNDIPEGSVQYPASNSSGQRVPSIQSMLQYPSSFQQQHHLQQ
ncbi:uncharacterized protein BDR25DRAFT_277253 [Lindgomyces ingoldianus]|uniref:Uncharacterized protein n=1 Tax=Lindgomyces ingoldianus TaxID=673940 RepID=A0ACB6RCP4_9PLEO|nr:uncharacterized protein BDR25DRAFT_277253 [Lindgomyces ingoldianus]KAF2476241.1 hypothetical protein BDR25DRAFT_277253 [Lindgomyces ingoldianus]